jgi:hypothetical protein
VGGNSQSRDVALLRLIKGFGQRIINLGLMQKATESLNLP